MATQTLQQFGQTIKQKYPQYSDMDDVELGTKMLAKYPQYSDMVDTASANVSSRFAVPETPEDQQAKIAQYKADAEVSKKKADYASSPLGWISNFGKSLGSNIASSEVNLANTISGIANTKNLSSYNKNITDLTTLNVNRLKQISELEKQGVDTTALKKQYNQTAKLIEENKNAIGGLAEGVNKTTGQVLGEVGGVGLDVLTAGTYGKTATTGMKSFSLAPKTKAVKATATAISPELGQISQQTAKGLFTKQGAKNIASGAGIGYATDVTQKLQNKEENPFMPGLGTAMGASIPFVSELGQTVKNAKNPALKAEKIINKRVNALQKIEDNNATIRKTISKSSQKGIDAKKILASTDLLVDSVDNTGTLRTQNAISELNDFIKPQEGVISDALKAEAKTIPLVQIEQNMIDAVNKSSIKGSSKTTALANIQKEIEGLKLDADEAGNIPLSIIHDAKVNKYANINYFNPESKVADKLIAKVEKELVEKNTSSIDVKKLNNELSQHFAVLDLLEKLDGKKVEGGKLGKYFAQTVGSIVGSHFGPLGAVVGAEAGGLIRGKQLSSTFSGNLGTKLEKSSAMENALNQSSSNNLGNRNITQINTTTATKIPILPKTLPNNKKSVKSIIPKSFKEAGVPKNSNVFTKEDAGLAKTIRESKGLSADDIMSKYPDIKLKKDIPAKDIHGNKIEIPQGETLTPYEIKGNKVLLQDGQTYIVAKNQFQNIKGNSIVAEGKKFAPELEGLEETIKGVSKWQGDELIDNGNRLADVYEENGKWHYRSDFVEESPAFKTRKEAMENAEADALGVYSGNDTKYSSYTLPGGENYREILIKAPEKSTRLTQDEVYERADLFNTLNRTPKENSRLLELDNKLAKENSTIGLDFKSSHWDEPNVISHIRMNDRTYNGKKVAFMEELQSDWAREARKDAGMAGLPERLKQPSHPLLKNWQEPTIKRALKDAVDNNAEYFAWTTGEQQSARYNLSKQIDEIEWLDTIKGGKRVRDISIRPKTGSSIDVTINPRDGIIIKSDKTEWSGKKIDEVIGKGIGEKIMKDQEGKLSEEGLNIGGEWANNLYDKQVKNIVEDLTGGKVEIIDLGLPIEKKVAEFYDLKKTGYNPIKPSELKVGNEIGRIGGEGSYIITDVLGDGKFKAVPKELFNKYPQFNSLLKGEKSLLKTKVGENWLKSQETFDISQKSTQQQAIKLTPEIKAIIKGEAPKLKKRIPLPNKKDQLIIKKNGIDIDLQKVERTKNLNEKDRNIETKAFEKIKKQGNKILNNYISDYGLITNTDNLRNYFRDVGYNGSNSMAVHEPSSLLKKFLWVKTLNKAKNGEAILYSGGSGSGKTSVANKFVSALKRDDTAVLDGNLSSLSSAERDIESTLLAGKTPHIVYIYREPLDAFMGTIKRFLTNKKEDGRIVPISVSSTNHPASLNVVKELFDKYGNDIKFTFINNSLGAGNAKKMTINDVKNINIPNNIKERMLSVAKEIYKNGLILNGKKYKITDDQYNNLIQ